MILKAVQWSWHRWRPIEGWLPVLLLVFIITMLVSAVQTVGWTPQANIVVWAAPLALMLALFLSKRPIGWRLAWGLIVSYGIVLITIGLARLIPPTPVVMSGWGPISVHVRQNWGLFLDRAASWGGTVSKGDNSQETIVFALGLGFLAWLLSAYLGWSTIRQHQPLIGLTLIGIALALNGFYGRAPVWPALLFIAAAILLTASIHMSDRTQTWDRKGVDYSDEIQRDLLLFSSGIALGLLFVAAAAPTIKFRALSRAVLDRPLVHQAEDTLERLFAGVQQPSPDSPGDGSGVATGDQPGTLPHSFLLGNPPELSETVVMTASVAGDFPAATHWRGLSYDVYTGRGWAVSNERQESLLANDNIPIPETADNIGINQSVNWILGDNATRYSLGLPLQFDQPVVSFWRGQDDLSRVQGEGNHYLVSSHVSAASATNLRQASLEEVPPVILQRYTGLPDTIPQRVRELAFEIASPTGSDPEVAPTPYDQVVLLEQFLRQYPYSLEVALPPSGTDPVDFFLFDLQEGYCDYYASSMVVMARSLGLPARLAIGYLSQPADDQGVQTVFQINAHSWAEVYFASYGWVEFEPTAAFPVRSLSNLTAADNLVQEEDPLPVSDLPPIPQSRPGISTSNIWLFSLMAVLLLLLPIAWWMWYRRQRQAAPADDIISAYGGLLRSARRLGQRTPPSQTPAEFEQALLVRLEQVRSHRLSGRLNPQQFAPEIREVTNTYTIHQYARTKPPASRAARSWRRIRGRLWLLGLIEKLSSRMRQGPTVRS
jgi:transglutaminase-like putative cysteine protease